MAGALAEDQTDALIEGLMDTVKSRCYTGLRHLDEVWPIGRRLPTLGIVSAFR